MKYILVTGGTGFIGSNLLAKLEKEGYNEILCIDNFDDEKWLNVVHRNLYIRFFLPSQIDQVLESYCNQISAVIHLGGVSATTETDVNKIVISNIQLTIQLYDYCKKYKIQFIYASSASTYGDGKLGFEDNETIDYLGLLKPLNPYAWSKLCIDKFIFLDRSKDSVDSQTVGLRFFNVYGPNEYHKKNQASVIYHFYNQIVKTNEVRLFASNNKYYKDGEQNRDFVHVDDCTNIIVWFLKNKGKSGLFNVGTGNSITFNEIAERIINKVNIQCRINYMDMPDYISAHYQNHTLANIGKLREVGYIHPFVTIEEGINSYIDILNSSDKYL